MLEPQGTPVACPGPAGHNTFPLERFSSLHTSCSGHRPTQTPETREAERRQVSESGWRGTRQERGFRCVEGTSQWWGPGGPLGRHRTEEGPSLSRNSEAGIPKPGCTPGRLRAPPRTYRKPWNGGRASVS